MLGKAVLIVFKGVFSEKQPAQTSHRDTVSGALKSSFGEKQMLSSLSGRGVIREYKGINL